MIDWRLRDVNVGLSGRTNVLRKLLRIRYRLRLFVSFCESSDWDWMKYTRCERLLLVKAFFVVFVGVVAFSSLENYFGFRTTNVRVKTDHLSVWGGIKRFQHFQRGLYFSDTDCAFDLWIDCVQFFAFFRRTELKPACILLLVVTVSFFKCPDLFAFAEPALSLSYVEEP